MRVKSSIILCLVCMMLLLFCTACADAVSCTLTVVSEYSGYGVDGQNLGSGSFTETFSVSQGDALHEDISGHWSKDAENNAEPLLTLKTIDEDSVTFTCGIQEITLQYGASQTVPSQHIVYDGRNFTYTVSFAQATPDDAS